MATMGRPLSSEQSAGGQEGNGEEKSRVTLSAGCKDPSHTQTLHHKQMLSRFVSVYCFLTRCGISCILLLIFMRNTLFLTLKLQMFFFKLHYTVDTAMVETQQQQKKKKKHGKINYSDKYKRSNNCSSYKKITVYGNL